MRLIRRILNGLQPSYLIRSYVIGLIFFALVVGMVFGAHNSKGPSMTMVVFAVISTLLFPFAKLVWDELRNLVLGSNMIFMNALFLYTFKLLINALLWSFAVFIAPLGLFYLWFRTRHSEPA